MSDTDTSILSGGLDTSSAPAPLPVPYAPDNSSAPITQPTPAPSAPVAPDVQVQTAAPNISTLTGSPTPPSAPPQAAGQPSVWKDLVMGAIYGLAGSAGAKHFGGGLAQGAAGYVQGKQQEVENANSQKQLQFESIKAADSHILAMKQAQEADDASAEHQAKLKMDDLNYAQTLKALGFQPDVTIAGTKGSEMHPQASGGLQTLADQNSGKIPAVATTNSPATQGDSTHTINVYSPSTVDVQQNPNGARKIVDQVRAVQGLPSTTDAEWSAGGGLGKPVNGIPNPLDGQRQMVISAMQALTVPSPSDKASENAATSAHMQQQLDTYKQNPQADPSIVKRLQVQLDTFNSAAENQRAKTATAESNTTLEIAPSKAEAARQEDIAKQNTPQGRAELAKTQQDVIDSKYKNADAHQKALFEEGVDPQTGERLNLANAPDEALVDSRTGQPIPTKMLSTLKPTQQESNRADFAKSALHSLDLIDQLKDAGKLPNGPVQGLSTKALIKAGLSDKDAADAYGLIALTQSAATGAHVGGRFSAQIMDKMNGLLKLNANDSQFEGQEQAIRQVMQPYAQQGGRETVGQYKNAMIGSVQTLKNGTKVKVTGLDKNGNFTGTPAQ